MAKMGVSKDALEGKPPLPAGVYDFRVDGFKPKFSKDKNSTNLNPVLKVINNPNGLNDSNIFFSLNTNAGFIFPDFVHSLGLQMDQDGEEFNLPGDWIPDPGEPTNQEKYKYQGPMVGRTGRLEIVASSYNGKVQGKVKQFFCAIPGCTHKHQTELK